MGATSPSLALSNSDSTLVRLSVSQFSQHTVLSPFQSTVDGLTSTALESTTDKKTISALIGGGFAYRGGRVLTMAAARGLTQGTFLPVFTKGASYLVGFGAESAAFAGIHRGWSHLDGHPPTQTFLKDWAHSAFTLAPLKVLPAVFRNQNLMAQHLVTDLGMVAGEHLAYRFNVGEKPEGDLATQLFHAEFLNWKMKGGLAFVHALTPQLGAMERSMDLFLRSQRSGPSFKELGLPPLSQISPATEGGPESLLSSGKKLRSLRPRGPDVAQMASLGGKGGGEKGPPPSGPRDIGEDPLPSDPQITRLKERAHEGDPDAIEKLIGAAEAHSDPSTRLNASIALAELKRPEARLSLGNALKDPDPRMHLAAVFALEELGDPQACDALKERLSQRDPLSRVWFARALNSLGDPEGNSLLKDFLEHQEPYIRVIAAGPLAGRGDLEAFRILKEREKDPDPDVREEAMRGLANVELSRMMDEDLVPIYELAKKDPSHTMVISTIKNLAALAKFGDEDIRRLSLSKLQELAKVLTESGGYAGLVVGIPNVLSGKLHEMIGPPLTRPVERPPDLGYATLHTMGPADREAIIEAIRQYDPAGDFNPILFDRIGQPGEPIELKPEGFEARNKSIPIVRSRIVGVSKELVRLGSVEGGRFGPVEISLNVLSTPSPIIGGIPTELPHGLLKSFKALLAGEETPKDPLPRGTLAEELTAGERRVALLSALDGAVEPQITVTMKADRTLLQVEVYDGTKLKRIFRDPAFLDFFDEGEPPPTKRSPK